MNNILIENNITNNEVNGIISGEKIITTQGEFLSFGKVNEDTNLNMQPINQFNLCSNETSADKKENYNSLNDSGFLNVSQNNSKMFLEKKKKRILSSEEIELEKIKKEKEDLKKQRQIHLKCYNKSKIYKPMNISPSPLTLIKPFNLSSSGSTQCLKKRLTKTNYEIKQINKKIKEKLENKVKAYDIQVSKSKEPPVLIPSRNNISYLTSTVSPINYNKYTKKIYTDNNNDTNMSLSCRINKYCQMTSNMLRTQSLNEKSDKFQI